MALLGGINQYDLAQRDVVANILEAYGIIGPEEVSPENRELFGPNYSPYWFKGPDGEVTGGREDKYLAANDMMRSFEIDFLKEEGRAAGLQTENFLKHNHDEFTSLQRILAGLEVESFVHTELRFWKTLDNFFEGMKTVSMDMDLLLRRKSDRRKEHISEEHRPEMLERAKRNIESVEHILRAMKEKMLDEEHPPSMADINTTISSMRGFDEMLHAFWGIMNAETKKPTNVG